MTKFKVHVQLGTLHLSERCFEVILEAPDRETAKAQANILAYEAFKARFGDRHPILGKRLNTNVIEL